MIERLAITDENVRSAKHDAVQMGRLVGSIAEGEGNVYGCLGEILVADRLDARIERTYDYDLVKNCWRIDVKTKRCTSEPRDHFECSIAAFNTRQRCDYYVFVRILEDMTCGWLLGAIRKRLYFELAKFHKKNEVDPCSNLGWRFKADCYNLPISKLFPVKPMEVEISRPWTAEQMTFSFV